MDYLISTDPNIIVSPATKPYISQSSLGGSGTVGFNHVTQSLCVYNGNHWVDLNSSPGYIRLSQDVTDLINWAKAKKSQEDNYKRIAEKYPSVDAAYKKLLSAQEQLEVTILLANEENK